MTSPRPLRVLCVGNIYPPHDMGGGYEITWRSAVAHLRRAGHEVRVLTTDFRAPRLDPAAAEDPDVHRELRWYLRDHRFPKTGLRASLAIERHNARTLDHHLRRFRPDVVNWWGMGGMSLSLIERVRQAGVPAAGVVGDEWMIYGLWADRWWQRFASRPRLAAMAERATGISARERWGAAGSWLFNSDTVRRRVLATGRILPRAAVAHPGIDHGLFRPSPERPWGWRLLYLGRIDERKGVDTAVDALALLPRESTLVLQGSGEQAYIDALRARAHRLSLDARVSFQRRPRAELPDVYADADAVVFPVRWEEPWGLVPLEAMAVGRPVVATGTGGSSEYLRHEENCLLFEPDSPEALAAAVTRLGADRTLRRRIVAAGLETASGFTEASYNEAIESALREAAGRAGS